MEIQEPSTQGFVDMPFPNLLPFVMKELDATPFRKRAKVIWTRRDPMEWAEKRLASHPLTVGCRVPANPPHTWVGCPIKELTPARLLTLKEVASEFAKLEEWVKRNYGDRLLILDYFSGPNRVQRRCQQLAEFLGVAKVKCDRKRDQIGKLGKH